MRVLDASVPGRRLGLRTYAEYPPAGFPTVSRLALGGKTIPHWAKDKAYAAGDVVEIDAQPMPGPLQATCVMAHSSTPDSEPVRGKDWKKHWTIKLPFALQCFADPLSAGAYDPTLQRASNWGTMRQFTLDFAFTLNGKLAVPVDDWRGICGVNGAWALLLHSSGQMDFQVVQPGNRRQSVAIGRQCSQSGTYRVAVEVNFTAGTICAWLCKPGETRFTRTCQDAKTLAPGSAFAQDRVQLFHGPLRRRRAV